MTPRIRLANQSDGPRLAAIYAPAVVGSTLSVEPTAPDGAEMGRRILETTAKLPWLVAETDTVLGYAYARPHRIVASYAWSVEVAIYIAPEAQRRGVARALYASLFAILKLQGYQNAHAGITVPNVPSRTLHESIGFQLIGTYRRVAFKDGRWLDLEWFAFALGSHPPDPVLPKPLPEVIGTPEFDRAFRAQGAPYPHGV